MDNTNNKNNLVDLIHKMNEKNPSETKQRNILSRQPKKPENYIFLKDNTVAEMGNKDKNKVIVKE